MTTITMTAEQTATYDAQGEAARILMDTLRERARGEGRKALDASGKRGATVEIRTADGITADAVEVAVREWSLSIEGEGEQPETIIAASEREAVRQAEELIAEGDYELASGEKTTVRYYLRASDGERVDAHVTVEG